MWETLGELWDGWAHGSARGLLAVAFTVLVAVWASSAIITFREARRTWRSPASTTPWVVAIPVLVAAIGIAQPSNFDLWALVGLGLAPVLALLGGVALRRSTVRCPRSHTTVPGWAFCPWCPSPLVGSIGGNPAPVTADHVGRSIGTLLRPGPGQPVPNEPLPKTRSTQQGPVLLWLVPDSGASEIAVRQDAEVGRKPASHVHVDDPTVSWEHARIVSQDGAPALVDLASSNGTYVNGERVESSLLLDDDRVQFGAVMFRVRRS